MKVLPLVSLPLLAGCASLRDSIAGVVATPGAAEAIGQQASEAASSGAWDGLLNVLTVSGIVPPWVSGPVLALLAFKRSRGHLVGSVKSVGKAIGIGHSSEASKKAADK